MEISQTCYIFIEAQALVSLPPNLRFEASPICCVTGFKGPMQVGVILNDEWFLKLGAPPCTPEICILQAKTFT